MRKIHLSLVFLFLLFISACEKEGDQAQPLSLEKVNGFVQKGPYLNGTSIAISELTDDLAPTGKIFSSQISDNKGSFEIKNVELSSQYVELKADGFYFNEVSNQNSAAQLTLFALSDLEAKSSLNVNVLSNLEKSRVNYLISKGRDFTNAKNQAQDEILSIFEIDKDDMGESESLDIAASGDDNAILLAISVILQGYLPVSDLSELLANISTDIMDDGELNSQSLGSALINNAITIKPEEIRANLEARYELLGMDVVIPDFEKYVNLFIEETEFEFTGGIKYPETGKHGLNILDPEKTDYSTGTYSMIAIIPEGMTLRVKIKGEYHWYYPAFQSETGWDRSSWNSDNSRDFYSLRSGEIDFKMMLESFDSTASITYTNQIDVLMYENGATEPTWTKVISID